MRYVVWTFGGTVPGPVIRVRTGDLVRINLVNEAKDMPHSIDFHAPKIPMDNAMKSIARGDSLQFEFEATTAGVFMVHCGTPPVLMHIAQGWQRGASHRRGADLHGPDRRRCGLRAGVRLYSGTGNYAFVTTPSPMQAKARLG